MRRHFCYLLGILSLAPGWALAQDGTTHGDPVAPVLMALAFLLMAAKIGGALFEKLGQPSVLGELVAGLVIGNLNLFGLTVFEALKTDPTIDILARLGVVILLFQVGLESNIKEMLKVGVKATVVALIGVIVPFALGTLATHWLLPEAPIAAALFIGAILCATSVGITARVFKDLQKIHTAEAKIVLGAAVIDDVLGLIVLAIMTGIVTTGSLSFGATALITLRSVGFLVIAVAAGSFLAPHLTRFFLKSFPIGGMKLTVSLAFAFVVSYLADLVGLATIVGAFAAGLVLDEVHFKEHGETHKLEELLIPINNLLVPLFFMLMGIQVSLKSFTQADGMMLAIALTLCAAVGKWACGVVLPKRFDRITVAIAMMPRGEVGLIFAAIGKSLGVVTDTVFSAVVVMVIVTTLMTPPLLKWSFGRRVSAP